VDARSFVGSPRAGVPKSPAVEKMPPAERQGLVRALTAFTAAGGEPEVQTIDIL
jgi:hypothetical protein